MAKRPQKLSKKTTDELFTAIENAIKNSNYYFTGHAEMRSQTRKKVTDLELPYQRKKY